METRIIIMICLVIFLIIGAWFAFKLLSKELKSRIYIYPKTKHRYLPIYKCKLKCPSTGEWFDAVIYKGVEDEKYYVREKEDFFNKFVKLNDFKNI